MGSLCLAPWIESRSLCLCFLYSSSPWLRLGMFIESFLLLAHYGKLKAEKTSSDINVHSTSVDGFRTIPFAQSHSNGLEQTVDRCQTLTDADGGWDNLCILIIISPPWQIVIFYVRACRVRIYFIPIYSFADDILYWCLFLWPKKEFTILYLSFRQLEVNPRGNTVTIIVNQAHTL